VDEAEEDDTGLNRVEVGRVLCVFRFRWWSIVACLRQGCHIGFNVEIVVAAVCKGK
jgi:hypothetical protein